MRAARFGIGAAAAAVAGALLSGCALGLEDLPAPAATSGATYHITAQFRDVQNLTLGAQVRLGGVVIGEVTSITTSDYRAAVRMNIEKRFRLGTDARFQIRFTTPLGEDFVSVASRGAPSGGTLADAAVVPLRNTGDAPGIEDTFAAVSTLLNGGGLGNLQTIVGELDAALRGRTGDARNLLVNLHKLIANLDAHRSDIDRTLAGLARLAAALDRGTGVVGQALDLFPPTLKTLTDDTGHVRALLERVSRLGDTVSGMLRRGQGALLADLDDLRPTLDVLRARQATLLPTFRSLIELGRSVQRAAPGDYLNISATIQFLLDAPAARPKPGGVVRPGAELHDGVHELLTGTTR